VDADVLAADVALRWERMQAVDALLAAVERRDTSQVREMAQSPAVREAFHAEVWTRLEVLSCFANSGCQELLEEAIAAVQAEPFLVSTPFSGGGTLLHFAAAAWNVTFVRVLLELGSDPNLTNSAGHPPLYFAGNRMPLRKGERDPRAGALVALFSRCQANLDAAEGVKLCTPLHMAARRGNADLAEALIDHGANIEARDSNGETPLRRAVNCSQPHVARVLIAAGADSDSRCKRGRTPRDAVRTAEMRSILQTD
jgi:ankyrin repeat protein